MKKVICSKVQTLNQSDLDKVAGGERQSDRSVSGSLGMSKGMSDKVNGGLCKALGGGDNCQGCGTGAKNARDTMSAANKPSTTRSDVCGCNSRCSDNRGGGGSSRVICTHFYRKGMLDKDIWLADLQFTEQHLSKTTVKGYHYWAVPYVELMRKNPTFEKVMLPFAKYRAYELAYKMGVRTKGSIRGKLIRLACEPMCYLIGLFCEQKEWNKLWTTP
jgi:hypothetical protein